MNCILCGNIPKYKCPTCREPYCSVACCKEHKQSPCVPPTQPPLQHVSSEYDLKYEYPTEDTVSPDKLKLLEDSKDVKKCIENPHVRTILELLDKSPCPEVLMKEYMQEPIFTEFVDACLNVVQERDDE